MSPCGPRCALARARRAQPRSDGGAGSRPVSRLLSPGGPGVAAIHLGPALPPASCGPPGDSAGPASAAASPRPVRPPIRPCSGWGLPSRPVTRPLVRSYRTSFTLAVPLARGGGLFSWHCPAGCPDWLLASTLPCGGRTFLDPGEPGPRPPSRLPPARQVCHPNPARRVHTGSMGPILAIAFIVVPLAELAVLIAVGDVIGLWPTLLLLLVVSLAGAWLARREGWPPGGDSSSPWPRRGSDRRGGPTAHMILLAGALLPPPVPHRRGRGPAAAPDPGLGPPARPTPDRAAPAPPRRPAGRHRGWHHPPGRVDPGHLGPARGRRPPRPAARPRPDPLDALRPLPGVVQPAFRLDEE